LVLALIGFLVLMACEQSELNKNPFAPANLIHRYGRIFVFSMDKKGEEAVFVYVPPAVPGEEGSWSQVFNNDTGAPVTPSEFQDDPPFRFGPPMALSSGREGGMHGRVTSQAASVPAGVAYLLDQYGVLYKFDPVSNAIVATLNFNQSIAGGAATSGHLAVTPDRNFAFITANSSLPSFAQGSATVLVVDLNAFSIVSTITLPVSATYVPWSPAVAITPDGTLAYIVTQPYSGIGPSNVFVIDVATRVITTTIPVPADSHLGQIAIAPDGAKAYLVDSLDTSAFTIQVLDLQSNTLDTPISIFPTTLNDQIGPSYIALHPDGTRLYFISLTGGPVQIVSIVTKAVTGTIPLAPGGRPSFGSQPRFTPDGILLAFMNGPESLVWVNTLTDTVDSTITLAPVPDGAIRNTGFFWVPGP
jgi:DNA-binding beta-propeller fold protein YncE